MSRAHQHEKLPSDKEQSILQMMNSSEQFTVELGAQFEEVRLDYARLRLPYRPLFKQPAGFVHGGVLATLIDTVVVPALFSGLDSIPEKLFTVDLHIHFLSPAKEQDLVAEGWVTKRGRSMAFLTAEVSTEAGDAVARGQLSYRYTL